MLLERDLFGPVRKRLGLARAQRRCAGLAQAPKDLVRLRPHLGFPFERAGLTPTRLLYPLPPVSSEPRFTGCHCQPFSVSTGIPSRAKAVKPRPPIFGRFSTKAR